MGVSCTIGSGPEFSLLVEGYVRGVQAAGDAAGLGEAELSLLEVVGGGNGGLGHRADHGKGGKD